jgi:hypothetical protein
MTKTQELQAQMKNMIDELDIAPYVADEAYFFINQLHYYKLKKIHEQKDVFRQYICAIDRENSKMIKKTLSAHMSS